MSSDHATAVIPALAAGIHPSTGSVVAASWIAAINAAMTAAKVARPC